jgi:hypothetical protein
MTVEIEEKVVKDLISFKLQHIQKNIDLILEKWKEDTTDEFIKKARTGELENAEMDAISIRQMLADYKRLRKLLDSINSDL